jgi:hydroxypyruvate isomerase
MSSKYNRREVLKTIALGSGVLSLGGIMSSFYAINLLEKKEGLQLKNKVNHSVCRWPYQDIPLEEFAQECAKIGLSGMDLLRPSEWETVEKYGLKCSMATDDFANIEHGFNDLKNHHKLQESYKSLIDKARPTK